MQKGDFILTGIVIGSLVGMVLVGKFDPQVMNQQPIEHSDPWPIWALPILSVPPFLMWCHLLYEKIAQLIKKYGRNWWKLEGSK